MLDIIITYYNNPEFLDDCLKSVHKQTYKNYKVYVVDDFSADSPVEVIKSWAKKLNIIYISSDENIGALKQLDRVYALSKSPFVVCLNHDDFWEETFLEKVLSNGLLKHTHCSLAYSLYSSRYEHKLEAATNHLVADFSTGVHNPLLHLVFSNWIQLSFTVFRRDFFDSVGGFSRIISLCSIGNYNKNRLLAGDSYSWARLLTKGPAYVVRERLGTKRQHKDSYGAINKSRHLEEVIFFNQAIYFDFDIFDDETRYFSLLVILSRLCQKKTLEQATTELFEKSLFSEEEFYSANLQSLKPELLKKGGSVLNMFYYDFERFGFRKLINGDGETAHLKI